MHYLIDLTIEERNIIMALVDAGIKAAGAQLLKEGGGALAQSAYDKLANAKEVKPPAPESMS